MTDADKMREKQRRAELKAQGIDPDAQEDKSKQYDASFMDKYNYDYGNEEEEKPEEEESKEEVMEEAPKGKKGGK